MFLQFHLDIVSFVLEINLVEDVDKKHVSVGQLHSQFLLPIGVKDLDTSNNIDDLLTSYNIIVKTILEFITTILPFTNKDEFAIFIDFKKYHGTIGCG